MELYTCFFFTSLVYFSRCILKSCVLPWKVHFKGSLFKGMCVSKRGVRISKDKVHCICKGGVLLRVVCF